jgi:RES domain-containing protein
MIFWRISQHVDLSGQGGRLVSGRWHTRGRPIVYMAECSPGAMLESLVQLRVSPQPLAFQLLRIEGPKLAKVIDLPVAASTGWQEDKVVTRMIGDNWLETGQSALARVPSALAPQAWNVLLNPEHPTASEFRITEVIRFHPDSRLL